MEYEFFSKDYMKLYFLDEAVNSGMASFKLFLESDGKEKDFMDVRVSGRSVYRFNNFNVSEDATNNCITFRPNVIGCYVYFSISSQNVIRVEIIKNGTNTVAQSFELGAGNSRIEFQPLGLKKYDIKVSAEEDAGATPVPGESVLEKKQPDPAINSFETDFSIPSPFDSAVSSSTWSLLNDIKRDFETSRQNSSFGEQGHETGQKPMNSSVTSQTRYSMSSEEVGEMERDIDKLERSNTRLNTDIEELENRKRELERKNQELIDKKKHLTSHLDRLQEEFDKDYSNFNAEVEEVSSKYNIDAEILNLYADKEVMPIEELLRRAEEDVKQIEEQIKIFVEAQERKTAEIESELKIGKKE